MRTLLGRVTCATFYAVLVGGFAVDASAAATSKFYLPTCSHSEPTVSEPGSVNFVIPSGGTSDDVCGWVCWGDIGLSVALAPSTVSIPSSGSIDNAYYMCGLNSSHNHIIQDNKYSCSVGDCMFIWLNGSTWSSPEATGSLIGQVNYVPTTECSYADPSVTSSGFISYQVNGKTTSKTCFHNFLGLSGYTNEFYPVSVTMPSGQATAAYYTCNGGSPAQIIEDTVCSCPDNQTMTVALDGSSWSSTDAGSLQGTITQVMVTPHTTCPIVEPSDSTPGSVNYSIVGGDTTRACSHDFTAASGFISSFTPSIVNIPSDQTATAYYSCDGGITRLPVSVGHTYTCAAGQTMTIGLDGSDWSSSDSGSLQGTLTQQHEAATSSDWAPWVIGSSVGTVTISALATGGLYLFKHRLHQQNTGGEAGIPLIEVQ